jgi:hypothetical protein
MRLFRSEEHVRRAYPKPGSVFPLAQLWHLARVWYGDRLDPDWKPPNRAQMQSRLESVGLTGPFWQF